MKLEVLRFKRITINVSLFIAFLGCEKTLTENDKSENQIFEGIYRAEFDNWDVTYAWIFTEDVLYKVLPVIDSQYLRPNKDVDYTSPIYYSNNEKILYFAQTVSNLNPISFKERSFYPVYEIKSIDTLTDGLMKQVIKLEEISSNENITLSKLLK